MPWPRQESPKLTDPGVKMIAVPKVVWERLDKLKRDGEPSYKLITRLIESYEQCSRRRGKHA